MDGNGKQKMGQIRVLQVLNRIECGSGVCAVILNYYGHMDNQKVIFDFLVHGETEPGLKKELLSSGCRIYQMPMPGVWSLFSYERALHRFFAAHQEYKIIHGNLPNAAVFYLRAAKKAGIPVRILHIHSTAGMGCSWKNTRNFLLNRIGVPYANVYFSCARKAALNVYGKKAGGARLVKNAVDTARYRFDEKKRAEYRRKTGICGELVLGHVGRFSAEKNHLFLLEILYAAKKKEISCKLLLAGDGQMREQIMRRVAELGLENDVICTGMTEETEGYLNAMDVFLLPSFMEGLPLAGIEAQCSGLPCVFSDAVTREAGILDTTVFLPAGSAEVWLDAAVKMQGIRTKDAWMQIERCGYSIQKEAAALEQYYIAVGRK